MSRRYEQGIGSGDRGRIYKQDIEAGDRIRI